MRASIHGAIGLLLVLGGGGAAWGQLSRPFSVQAGASPEAPTVRSGVELSATVVGGVRPYAYRWTQERGLPVRINGADQAVATVRFVLPGAYAFRVAATEGRGRTASALVEVNVTRTVRESDCINGAVPPEALAPQDAVNGLLAQPWAMLVDQFHQRALAAVEALAYESDTGTKTVSVGPADLVNYRIRARLASAELTDFSLGPPGYEILTDDHLRLAIPLQGTWSVGLRLRFEGRAQVWASPLGQRIDYMDQSFSVTETLELRNLRLTADLHLDTREPDRPMLDRLILQPQVRFLGHGFWGFLFEFGNVDAVIAPGGVLRFVHEKDVFNVSIGGFARAALDVRLVLTLMPTVGFKIDGDLELELAEVGRRTLPFSLTVETGVELPEEIREQIPVLEEGLPRRWGEGKVVPLAVPEDDAPFFSAAAEIELAVAPHFPRGLAYEIQQVPILRIPNTSAVPADATGPARDDGSVEPKEPRIPSVAPIDFDPDNPCGPLSVVCTTYDGYTDTAIWTGHYLAGQAFRYAAAQTDAQREAALERVHLSLGGIEKLFEITQVSGLVARAALPDSSLIQTDPPLNDPPSSEQAQYYGPVVLNGETWHGYGRGDDPPSRDQYTGVMMGLAFAYALVDDEDVRGTARQLLSDALCFLLRNGWNVPTPPDGEIITTFIHQFHQQLAFLRIGKTIDPERFGAAYDRFAAASQYAWIPLWGTTLDPIPKYFKFNLTHGNLAILLFLEEDPALRAEYLKAFRMVRRSTGHHRNAYFNLVRILVERPEDRLTAIHEPAGSNPQFTLGQETRALLQEWLWRRDAVPGPNGLSTERTPDPEFLAALFPFGVESYEPLFPEVDPATTSAVEAGHRLLSISALPVHKRPGATMDFVWQRLPFSTGMCVHVRPRPFSPPSRSFPDECFVPTPEELDSIRELLRARRVDVDVNVDPGRPRNAAGQLIGTSEGPAIDYTLPFWMAVYLGVVTPPAAPTFVNVMDGLGTAPDVFISPLGENVPFSRFDLRASQPLENLFVVGTAYTGPDTAPTVASFSSVGDGTHVVTLDRPMSPGHWLELNLEFSSPGTSISTASIRLAHLPLDVNQDGTSNIRDATAFSQEFGGRRDSRLVDTSGNAMVDIRDVTAFGANWNGTSPATKPWRNTSLPEMP